MIYLPHRRKAFRSKISNGSFVDDDCSSLTGWADQDESGGISTQETFDGRSTFKFWTDTQDYSLAIRSQDFGSLESVGNRVVVTVTTYIDQCGLIASNDDVRFMMYRSDWRFIVKFASDGLGIMQDGGSFAEAGTNLITLDTWQEWTFDIDLSSGVGDAICDVYLNEALQVSDFACDPTGSYTDGYVTLAAYGYTSGNVIGYFGGVKIGDGFALRS